MLIKGVSTTKSERKHAAWQVPMTRTLALYGHGIRQLHLFQVWFLVQNSAGFSYCVQKQHHKALSKEQMVTAHSLQVTLQKEHQPCSNAFL